MLNSLSLQDSLKLPDSFDFQNVKDVPDLRDLTEVFRMRLNSPVFIRARPDSSGSKAIRPE